MTATSTRVLTTIGFLALLWAPPATARVDGNDPPAGMQVQVSRNGTPVALRAMVLHAGSQPKGAALTAANTATLEEEDVEDRRRAATLFLDEFADGSASLQIVLEGVTVPQPLPGSTRRDLGGITVRRGARFVVDAGTGTVTDTTESPATSTASPTAVSTAPAAPAPGWGRPWSRFFISGNGGVSSMVPSLSFCQDNATRLSTVGASQDACGLNGTSGAYGLSVGFSVARVGGWDLFGSGGYASFGRTQPEADGSTRNVTITRRAEQDFMGPWVGAGFERNWSSWRLRPTVGVAFVRRETSNTDTFTRLSDQLVSQVSTNRHDTAVQPMVSFELYRRAGPYFFVGTGYRFTQFKDDVLTQRLHSIYATLGWTPSKYRRPYPPIKTS